MLLLYSLVELNKLIQILDRREKRKNLFKKIRRQSEISSRTVPPSNAPSWAVQGSLSQSPTTNSTVSY